MWGKILGFCVACKVKQEKYFIIHFGENLTQSSQILFHIFPFYNYSYTQTVSCNGSGLQWSFLFYALQQVFILSAQKVVYLLLIGQWYVIKTNFLWLCTTHTYSATRKRSWYGDMLWTGLFGKFKAKWGWEVPDPFGLAPRPTQPPVQWVPGLFPGSKVAKAWC
jgi:hypothetical protein